MSRSNYKGIYTVDDFSKIKKQKFKIFNKNLIILPEYVNFFFYIYNGYKFIYLKINENMVGYKFGEFIYTKKKHVFKKKIK